MPSLFPFFQWASDLWIANWVRQSIWIFPALETVHIVALAVLFGAVLFVDLQMLGIIRRDAPVASLAEELRPWTFCSLVVILITGGILFTSEATKLYISVPFQAKVVTLFLAILFHYTIHRRVTDTKNSRINPGLGKLTAIVSLVLWLSVGFAGRAIGFF